MEIRTPFNDVVFLSLSLSPTIQNPCSRCWIKYTVLREAMLLRNMGEKRKSKWRTKQMTGRLIELLCQTREKEKWITKKKYKNWTKLKRSLGNRETKSLMGSMHSDRNIMLKKPKRKFWLLSLKFRNICFPHAHSREWERSPSNCQIHTGWS